MRQTFFFILWLMRSIKGDVNLIKKLLYKYKNKLKICLLIAVLTCTGKIQDLQMDRSLYVFKPIIMLCYIALTYRRIS
jgi:hypothetical protein